MKRTAKTLLVATALLAGLAATAVAAPQGVTRYRDTIGSQSANIVTVEMKAGRTGQVVLAGDSVVRDDTTANLIAKQQANGASTLVAAINGGFFNSYYTGAGDSFPDNCPQIYNTIIQNGKVVNAGGAKPVLGFTADGKAMIDKVGFRTMIKLGNGFSVGTWGVNYLYDDPEATMLFTDELTLPVNIPNSSTVVYIKNGTVEKITGGGTTTVPAGTDLLVYNSAVALTEQNIGRFPKVGESAIVYYNAEPRNTANTSLWNNMETVVGGGPILLLDGWVVTDQNPEFTQANQQPNVSAARSFVGVTYSGNLVMGTVTGTFNDIAAYLKGQGVKDAMAMDGGASSMLYVEGDGYVTSPGRRLASILTIVDRDPNTPPITVRPSGVDDGGSSGTGAQDDGSPSAWAKEVIDQAISMGLVPENMQEQYRWNIRRGEFCVLVVRFLQEASGKKMWELTDGMTLPTFSDTTDSNILNCAALGIVQGRGDGTFDPEGHITRAEAAVILTNAAKALGVNAAATGQSFADAASIPAWAADAVNYVSANGVMQGDGTNFNPSQNYTREQAIKTIVTLLDAVK